jgi:hypothetical protein
VGGKAHGAGKLVWRYLNEGAWETSSYEGDKRDGKLHGRGVYVLADGARYEGDYRDGKLHGFGDYSAADGQAFMGTWTNGCYRQGKRWAIIGVSRSDCGF